jgi:hypothetical protein
MAILNDVEPGQRVRFRVRPSQCGPDCRITVRVMPLDPFGGADIVRVVHQTPDAPVVVVREIRIDRAVFRAEQDAEAAIQQLLDRELAAWGDELHPPRPTTPPLTAATLDEAMRVIEGPSDWIMRAARTAPAFTFGDPDPDSGYALTTSSVGFFDAVGLSTGTARRTLAIATGGPVFYMPYPEVCEQRGCELAVRDPSPGINTEQNASIVHPDERFRPYRFTRGLLNNGSIAAFAAFAEKEHARVAAEPDDGSFVIEVDEGGPPVRQTIRLREACRTHGFGFDRYPGDGSSPFYGRFFHGVEGQPLAYYSITLAVARDQVLDAYIDPWLVDVHGATPAAPKRPALPAAYHGIALPMGALVRTPGRPPSFLDRITTQER